jgi:TP901 family phage tail tape measure protein
MPDYDLGTARGKIEIDASGAQTGVAKANQAQSQLESGAKRSSDALRSTGLVLGGIGVAAVVGFGAAIKVSSDFEKELSAFKAVTGIPEAGLERIRKKALQLGADTAFSAGEAATAMTELGKSGLSVEDILNGAADAVVSLAAAGEVDLATSAKITAAAMNQFKLSAKDLPRVADILAGAANASATGVEELGLAMEYVGPVARAAGVSFEDTASAAALLANNGIDANKAGTALRSILVSLQPTTDKARAAMEKLGLITEDGVNKFYRADGSLKDMRDIVGLLQGSFGGLTEAEQTAFGAAIFGREALAGVTSIAGTTTKEFDKLQASIGKIKAADVAKDRLDNLSGSMEQLKGSIETALIQAGAPFQEVLRGIVDSVTKVVNVFSGLPASAQKMIVTVVLAAGAFAGFAGALMLGVTYFRKFKATMEALKIGAMLANPVFLVIAAIAALAVGFYLLYKRSKTFRDIVNSVFSFVKQAFSGAVEGVKEFGKFVGDAGRSISKGLKPAIAWAQKNVGPLFKDIADLVKAVIGRVVSTLKIFAPALKAVFSIAATVLKVFVSSVRTFADNVLLLWRKFGDNIIDAVKLAFKIIKTTVETVLGVIRGIIKVVTGLISGDWKKAWEGIKQIFSSLLNGILNAGKLFIEALKLAFRTFLDAISASWTIAFRAIRDIVKNILPAIKDIIESILKAIWGIFANIGDKIRGVWDDTFGKLVTLVAEAMRGMRDTIKDIMGGIFEFFAKAPGRILSALGDLGSTLVDTGKGLIRGLWNGIKTVWRAIDDWMDKMRGKVLGVFADAKDWLVDAGRKIIEGLWEGMKEIWKKVSDWAGNVGGWIKDKKGPAEYDAKLLVENGELIMSSLWKGMNNGLGEVMTLASDVAPMIQSTVAMPPVPSIDLGGRGGGDTFQFVFPGVGTAEDAREVEEVMKDGNTLDNLVRAIKVGRKT